MPYCKIVYPYHDKKETLKGNLKQNTSSVGFGVYYSCHSVHLQILLFFCLNVIDVIKHKVVRTKSDRREKCE